MLLNFDDYYVDFKGNRIKDHLGKEIHLGKTLANILDKQEASIHSLKIFDWCLNLYKTGKIDIDQTDMISLKNMVQKLKSDPAKGLLITHSIKAQFLKVFLNAESIEMKK